ncbi:MAG: hypothetical protein ACPMAG_03185 [Limisphaerales bacterium]|jgi:tetratricopeptide (TPR) repeat protein
MNYLVLLFIFMMSVCSSPPLYCQSEEKSATNKVFKSGQSQTDTAEIEYQKLIDADDEAQAEIDDWIKQTYLQQDLSKQDSTNSISLNQVTLKLKIQQRLDALKKEYEIFLKKYPDHIKGRIAYASFLSDIGKEEESRDQLEIAKQKDPKNPAIWNNLANYYGHNGPATNAFIHYQKAIELNPNESVYYRNYATTVYIYRDEAMEFFKLSEEQVIRKAMGLYKKAIELDPENFLIASDLAQTYYGFKLPSLSASEIRTNKLVQQIASEAIEAWRAAEKLAKDDMQKQGCLLHIGRWQITAMRLADARKTLEPIDIEEYRTTKEVLLKKLESAERELAKIADQPDISNNTSEIKREQ